MIKYIIVDDEIAAHDNIQDYASNLSYLSFQKSCYNAFEALEYLNKHSVDLIFLDINMPKLSGLDFLKTLSNPPKIIITTAYKEFALECYELNIEDYLLKPFNFSRFVKSVSKVSDALANKPISLQNLENTVDTKIFIKEDKKHYQIKLKDILFIEAYGNYVKVYMVYKMIVSHLTLTSFTHNLPESQFIRVYKSFIISIDKIELIEGNTIHLQDHKIPIGKMYKLNVNRLIK